jgi:hypothetical protein
MSLAWAYCFGGVVGVSVVVVVDVVPLGDVEFIVALVVGVLVPVVVVVSVDIDAPAPVVVPAPMVMLAPVGAGAAMNEASAAGVSPRMASLASSPVSVFTITVPSGITRWTV